MRPVAVICPAILCLLLCAACASHAPSNQPQPAANNATTPQPEPEPEPQPEPEPPAPKLRRDIVVTTGVHGNEPSGWLVQDELIEMGFVVFGPCNPWGIQNNSRFLEDGRDLNRSFNADDCPEADAVKAFLAANPPPFLLDLHEDPDGKGAYLIQHGPNDPIGREIIDALKSEFEFDPAPRFSVVKGEDGLLLPNQSVLNFMKLGGVWGLGYHAWLTYGCTAIVVECPGTWPEEKRKRYQLRVCEEARRIFSERHPK